jgi:hypothetical protein
MPLPMLSVLFKGGGAATCMSVAAYMHEYVCPLPPGHIHCNSNSRHVKLHAHGNLESCTRPLESQVEADECDA